MKLKTTMVGPDSTSKGPYPAARENDDGQDYLHDAAAAHALMQAMDETEDAASIIWARRRADEIMHSWGFDSAEVSNGR